MSFNDVIVELPTLSVAERQQVLRRVLELDDAALSPADEALVNKRLEEHIENPTSTISFEEMETRLRSRFGG